MSGFFPPFVSDLVFGGASAAISKTLTAPWDTLKLAQQIKGLPLPTTTKKFHHHNYNSITGVPHIAREHGFSALFAGNLIGVIRCFVAQPLNWLFKDLIKVEPGQLLISSLAGTLTAALTLLLVHPLETIATREVIYRLGGRSKYYDIHSHHHSKHHHHHHKHHSEEVTGGVLTDMVKKEGFLSLYSGFGISVLGIFVHRVIFFSIFGSLKPFFRNILSDFWLGQVVTILASLISYPFDTVRRAQMLGGGSVTHVVKMIYENNGFYGFFQGASANTLRIIFYALVAFGFDATEKFILSFLA